MRYLVNRITILLFLSTLLLYIHPNLINAEDSPVYSGSRSDGGIILRDDLSADEYRQLMNGQGKPVRSPNTVNPRLYQDDYKPVADPNAVRRRRQASSDKKGATRATVKSKNSRTTFRSLAKDVRKKGSGSQTATEPTRSRLSFQGLAKQVRKKNGEDVNNSETETNESQSRFSRLREKIQE